MTNPYWIGVRNTAGTHELVFCSVWQALTEYHPSGTRMSSNFGIGQGDLVRIEMIPGGQLTYSVNGSVKYTTVGTFFTPLAFDVNATAAQGTVYLPPRFFGAGVTGYTHAESTVFVQPDLLLPSDGCELYCEPQLMTATNGSSLSTLTDFSGRNRHLTAGSPAPTFQTGVLNGKSVVRFNGVQPGGSQPLKNSAPCPVRCGWIVAKYDGAAYPVYSGLFTGFQNNGILVGNLYYSPYWYYFYNPFLEIRAGDRIYPATLAPGPVGAYQGDFLPLLGRPHHHRRRPARLRPQFFEPPLEGRRRAAGALLARFTEEEVRLNTKKVADNFALQLADVYPYQADVADTTETAAQSVSVYDPPEGGSRIVEVLDNPKRMIELKFSVADGTEIRAMKTFHRAHYPEVPCFYRDYRFTPPEDIEGYIDSPYELEGSGNDFQYSFRFREK